MRVKRNRRPLPRSFFGHPDARGLLAEGDIRPQRRGRLYVKVLVFKSAVQLRGFWRKALGSAIPRAYGVVTPLAETVHLSADGKYLRVDPRYFCIMGLSQRSLTAEVIAHEAVHAAFCYAKRKKGNFNMQATHFDEENICYPTGTLTHLINEFLHKEKLYIGKANNSE